MKIDPETCPNDSCDFSNRKGSKGACVRCGNLPTVDNYLLALRNIVARYHVATSGRKVRADIRALFAKQEKQGTLAVTPELIPALLDKAVALHAENLALYQACATGCS